MVWGSPPKEPYTLYQILYIYILLYNELGLEFTLVRFGSAQGGTLDIAVHRSFECFLGHSHAF